jgi:hypothetical protein
MRGHRSAMMARHDRVKLIAAGGDGCGDDVE